MLPTPNCLIRGERVETPLRAHHRLETVAWPVPRFESNCESALGATEQLQAENEVAIAEYLARRCSRASRQSWVPRRLRNSGSECRPARSAIMHLSSFAVPAVSGVTRCLRPLPKRLTCAPVPSCTSPTVNAKSLLGRRPVWQARTSIALSRRPFQVALLRKERVDLLLGEVGDEGGVKALGRDRQDAGG